MANTKLHVVVRYKEDASWIEGPEYFARVLRGSVLKIDNRNLGVDR